jgi:ABC-2 type transport system ATP-binding protein
MLKGGRIVALDTTKALIARAGGTLEQAFVQIMNAQPSKFSEAQA